MFFIFEKATMTEQIEDIRKNLQEKIKGAKTLKEAEQIKIHFLGRNGVISHLMKQIPLLPVDQRSLFGKTVNSLKAEITETIEKLFANCIHESAQKGRQELFDITLPGKCPGIGKKHPLTQTIEDIKEVFSRLGFDVAYGPEVELEYYNFEALNIPSDHPSRTDFDTFYIKEDVLLRSQTSTVQIRTMEKCPPPIRIIAPGVVYRPDTVDARHSFMFHQVEGLLVDEDVSFADLKGVLEQFIKTYFGHDVQMRFRPSFFPFTEPSAEVDISCSICKGKGCSVCSYSGWVEILGAGMVDPNVFKAVRYDEEKYAGFAFGMGVERITMLKYGIDDIRLFYENDIRFLSQF
ncbi:MAG: phenylalanine--tRNA ligase subunit alpha [Candidatus Brocadiaceae bacterium]|nr:phenylalanine--tRNA ligase subunit alpha [Candidatus Brocadiaceae bacterium]